ncbi:MAG: hypothetical protein AAGM38_18365 [Pseudomonadota bacterium]
MPANDFDPNLLVYEITKMEGDFPWTGYKAEPFGFAGLYTILKVRPDLEKHAIDTFERRLEDGEIDPWEPEDERALRELAETHIQGGADALPEYNKIRFRTFWGD